MTHLEEHSLPYMDKALPDAWKAATTFASAISKETTQHGAVIRGRRDHQDPRLAAQRMRLLPRRALNKV